MAVVVVGEKGLREVRLVAVVVVVVVGIVAMSSLLVLLLVAGGSLVFVFVSMAVVLLCLFACGSFWLYRRGCW